MSDDQEVIETHRMPDGTEYRAVIKRDPEPSEPYDDGGWPILRIQHWRMGYPAKAEAFNDAASPYVEKFNRLTVGGYNTEVFERYLRIFHGVTLIREYGRNQFTDNTYIAFDTEEWRDRMGLAAPPLSNETPLSEIEAWLEGDVWGIGVEKRYNPDEDQEPDDGWAEDEYMGWGYYTAKHAKSEAEHALKHAVTNHKTVYRYTEHEKITANQTKIDAVLEFLELPPAGIALGRWEADGSFQPAPARDDKRTVYGWFGIDYDKIEAERKLMLKRMMEANSGD
jgi:hypothetical protein